MLSTGWLRFCLLVCLIISNQISRPFKNSKFSRPFKFEIPARFFKLNYTKISNLIIKFCGLVAGFDEVEIMRHTDNIVVVFRISCFVVDEKVKGGWGG